MYEPSKKAQAPQNVLQLMPQRWYFCSGYAKNPKKPLHVQHTLRFTSLQKAPLDAAPHHNTDMPLFGHAAQLLKQLAENCVAAGISSTT